MTRDLEQLQADLGYRFRSLSLLEEAMTHASFLAGNPEVKSNNQRLEFLGDAILHFVLTDALFRLFPDDREGRLSQRRAMLTQGSFLIELARRFNIDRHLRLSASEESTGGRTRGAAVEDALEALIGAIYLDSDLPTVRGRILAWWGDLSAHIESRETSDNPKGRLQELIQPSLGNAALRYDVAAIIGRDHARTYNVAVFLNNSLIGRGSGSSKKKAESAAALDGLAWLEKFGLPAKSSDSGA
ncbi:MAG: ribonuclease III [Opitutaceae bacterium]|nr:ribonuclease III [Opitutaceae bacterium]